jgi:uncharacterized membrane protein YeiB
MTKSTPSPFIALPHGPAPPLTGIRGWLYLLAIGMILNPIGGVMDLIRYYQGIAAAFQQSPTGVIGDLIINLTWLAFICYTTAVFFGERRIFKKAFTVMVFTFPAPVFLDLIWVSAATGVPLANLISMSVEEIGKSLGSIIGGIPWVAYVWRSRRVANTFTR